METLCSGYMDLLPVVGYFHSSLISRLQCIPVVLNHLEWTRSVIELDSPKEEGM